MSRGKGGMLKFLAGVGIGVGAGMLLAPKKGEELRKELSEKINELLEKAKEIDIAEVSENVKKKAIELKEDIKDLDKEKVLKIAKTKSEELKEKANELLDIAKENGSVVFQKAASEVREKAIEVTKEILKKLESEEKSNSNKEETKKA